MSWVEPKLVCIICLKRFETESKGKSSEPGQVHNSGGKDSPILLDELSDLRDGKEERTCEEESGGTDTGIYKRFLMFISQYFKLRTFTDRLITCAKDAKSDDGTEQKLETFCDSCAKLVSEICNLYKEIQTAKLLLAWKLSQVGQLIRKSKVPMSNKLTKELKTCMKKQMNLDAVRPVDIFRTSLQVKCIRAANEGLPDVIMHRGLFPDEWKFTYSSTKEALVRLIAIFILGSTRYASYHRHNKEPQNSNKILGGHRPGPKSKKRAKFSTDTETPLKEVKITVVVKNEPGSIITEAITNDDVNAFSGSDHDDDIPEPENAGNDSDSDWSGGGATSPMIVASEIPADSTPPLTSVETSRKVRWNLRGRRNLIVKADEDEEEETDTEEKDKPKKIRRPFPLKSKLGYRCPECPKVCKDRRGLSVHIFCCHRSRVHHNCKKCGMRFKRALDLQIHNKKVHVNYNSRGNPIRGRAPVACTCSKCGESFPARTDLYLHEKADHKMHRGTRHRSKLPQGKFACNICGTRCVDSIALAAHLQRHEDNSIPNKMETHSGQRLDRRKTSKLFSEQKEIDKLVDPASPPPPGKILMGHPMGRPWFMPVTPKDGEIMKQKFTKLSCDVENCGKTLESAYLLRKHLENDHESMKPETEKNIQCYHCYKRFCYQQSHEIHVRAQHKNKIYGNFKCDSEDCVAAPFISVEELNAHLKTHLELEPHSDSGPGPKEIYMCGTCDWGFLRPEVRDLHRLVHISPDKHGHYTCPMCKMTYTPHFLKYHFNKEHGANLRPYKCDECDNTYFIKSSLAWHKKTHDRRRHLDPEEKLMCVQCGVYVKDHYMLKMHMKTHLPPSDRFVCEEPFCGQKFVTKFKLMTHTKRIHGTRDFICEECGQGFFFRGHLREHYKTHNKDGGFPCDECAKVFKTLVLVTRHKNTVHLKDRKLSEVCSVCGKSFYTLDGLRYHFDGHHKPESEWHLKCPTCPRRFYRSAFLRTHEKKCDGSGKVVTRVLKKDAGESKTVNEKGKEIITKESSTIKGDNEIKPSTSQQQQAEQKYMNSSSFQQPLPPSSQSQHSDIPNFPQMQFHQPFMNP